MAANVSFLLPGEAPYLCSENKLKPVIKNQLETYEKYALRVLECSKKTAVQKEVIQNHLHLLGTQIKLNHLNDFKVRTIHQALNIILKKQTKIPLRTLNDLSHPIHQEFLNNSLFKLFGFNSPRFLSHTRLNRRHLLHLLVYRPFKHIRKAYLNQITKENIHSFFVFAVQYKLNELVHITLRKAKAIFNIDIKCTSSNTYEVLVDQDLLEEDALQFTISLWRISCRYICRDLKILHDFGKDSRGLIATTLTLDSIKGLRGLTEDDLNTIFGNYRNITELHITDCDLTGEGLRALAQFRHLESLSLHDCEEIDSTPPLNELPNLKTLSIRNCPKLTSLEKLEQLRDCIYFENLDLSQLPITHLNGLEQIVDLKQLHISNCPQLFKLPSIKNNRWIQHLELIDLPISTIKPLTHMENLRSLTIQNCPLLQSLPSVNNCHSLQHLLIQNCPSISSNTMARFAFTFISPEFSEMMVMEFFKSQNFKVIYQAETLYRYLKLNKIVSKTLISLAKIIQRVSCARRRHQLTFLTCLTRAHAKLKNNLEKDPLLDQPFDTWLQRHMDLLKPDRCHEIEKNRQTLFSLLGADESLPFHLTFTQEQFASSVSSILQRLPLRFNPLMETCLRLFLEDEQNRAFFLENISVNLYSSRYFTEFLFNYYPPENAENIHLHTLYVARCSDDVWEEITSTFRSENSKLWRYIKSMHFTSKSMQIFLDGFSNNPDYSYHYHGTAFDSHNRPEEVLNAISLTFRSMLKSGESLEKIKFIVHYTQQPVIDHGAVKRDLFFNLAQSLQTIIPINKEIPAWKDSLQSLYYNLGTFLRYLIQINIAGLDMSTNSIKQIAYNFLSDAVVDWSATRTANSCQLISQYNLGSFLHPSVLPGILNFTYDEVNRPFEAITKLRLLELAAPLWIDGPGSEMFQKMLTLLNWDGSEPDSDLGKSHLSFIEYAYTHFLFEEIKIQDVENQLFNWKNELLDYFIDSKKPQLKTLLEIAKGMCCNKFFWHLFKILDAKKIHSTLKAQFTKEQLSDSLRFDLQNPPPKEFVEWIKSWIASKTIEELEVFMTLVHGSPSIPPKGLGIYCNEEETINTTACFGFITIPQNIQRPDLIVALNSFCLPDKRGFQNL